MILLHKLEYDPELARKYLADAGYPNGEGFPEFELLYNTNEGHQKIAQAIQQFWLKELGIKITLQMLIGKFTLIERVKVNIKFQELVGLVIMSILILF